MEKYSKALLSGLGFDSWELKNVDGDDISEILSKIEKSFHFRFEKNDLKEVRTFGELCNIITTKTQGYHCDDCSTQQAFYKLREAMVRTTLIDKADIKLDTKLQELFPPLNRRRTLKLVEAQLGFELKLLQPKGEIVVALILLFLTSLVYLFYNWKFGLGGLLIFIHANHLANKTANEMSMETVQELVNKLTRENYRRVRRYSDTINRKEVGEQVKMTFMEDLSLDSSALHKEATLG